MKITIDTSVRYGLLVLLTCAGLISLYQLSVLNYLLFHGIVEFFSIVIIFAIFVIAWNSRYITKNNYFLYLGITFFFVGILNLFHTLSYKGMGVFPEFGANLPTQLWICTRYLLSISLLSSLFFINRKFRPIFVFIIYSIIVGLIFGTIFYWRIFPTAYVDSTGLTPFKIISEYLISFILLCSIILMIRKREKFSEKVFKLMASGIAISILSELAFTLYTDVYDITNIIGHLLNVVSFYVFYKALVVSVLKDPFNFLFRNLKQNEIDLTNQTNYLKEINKQLLRETTERKKAEEKIKKSEEKFHGLFSNMSEGFGLHEIILDKDKKPSDYRFLELNESFEKLTGLLRKKTLGKTVKEIIPDIESFWINTYGKVALTGEPVHFENYSKSLGRWYEIYSYSPRKNQFATIFTDITERKKAEGELHQAQIKLKLHAKNLEKIIEERTKQLKDSERLSAIGETAGMIGHDIRNPLQSIDGAIYLANEEINSLPVECKQKIELEEIFELIKKQINYINNIVADLQDFARREPPHSKETNLQNLLVESLSLIDIPKNIQVEKKVEGEYNIGIDPAQLKRVFSNLIRNAVQAMPNGGKLTINIYDSNESVIIDFKDTGVGIAEKNKANIFKPLFTTKSKGQGFGLAVCKKLVDAQNGEITFKSIEGKGTIFTIKLPISRNGD